VGLELGDRVRILGCGCEDADHNGHVAIVSSLGTIKRLATSFASEVQLRNGEVCQEPVYLELLP
jgi:hypothetical protein